MKKLIGIVLFVGVLAIAANVLMKGGLPFKQSLSEDEQAIASLRSELRDAQAEYRQAGRAAGLSGVDTTAQAGPALAKVDRIERQLVELKGKLKNDVARQAAERLHDEIRDFKSELK